jgi:putative oxidoreductase
MCTAVDREFQDVNDHRQAILQDVGLLLFRTGLSLSVFIAHGIPKISNILNGHWDFPDPAGLGPELGLILSAGAESVCTLLIALGILTRVSTIPLIFTMVVATWVINGGAPFIQQEKSFVYLLGWLLLLLAGPGRYTVVYAYRTLRSRA